MKIILDVMGSDKGPEELIKGVNGRIVGYVVNGVDLKSGSAYYYAKRGRYSSRAYYSPYRTDKTV